MIRRSSPARPARRHRRQRQPFGAWTSVAVGRGAVLAVAGGLVLVGLVVVAVILGSPDPGSGPRGAEAGSRDVGDAGGKGDPIPVSPSPPAATTPAGEPSPSAPGRSPQTPAAQPSQASQPPQPTASGSTAPQPTKGNGKSQKDKPHPTPGHGSTHGPGKP